MPATELTTRCAPVVDVPRNKAEVPDCFPKGRRCIRPGCDNVLGQYNAGPACYPCRFDDMAGRTLAGIGIQELMEQAP